MTKRKRSATSRFEQGAKFAFTPAMAAVVIELLAEFSTLPVLVYPNWGVVIANSVPFLLYFYTSIDGFDATLDQQLDGHTIRPIAFISRTTTGPKRLWIPLDLEAGGTVWSITRLRGRVWVASYQFPNIFGPQDARKPRQACDTQPASTAAVARVSHREELHSGISQKQCQQEC